MSVDLAHIGTALAGRYTVEGELGRGGMATVYLADDPKHRRKVAIKVFRPELGALVGPDRFTREIRIAAALSHPHILPLHDSGEADRLLFYVMPYVRGGSLRQKLAREGRLSVEEAINLVRQVASALDHAHSHGLVHRDIKPENILLHEGEAVVTDFGIALAVESAEGERLTQAGLTLGTPEYMSPEQAAGEQALDARSDLYSLACVLYELLAGEPPHTGPGPRAVIARRFSEPAPRIRRLRPDVSPPLEDAIARALAVDPGERFADVAAFADAIAGAPVAPRVTRLPSVAVLPFVNLSADPENEFFADGITEDVIAHLSKISALKVIGRGSVMPYKRREQSVREIAIALDVGTLLDGSVRRAGNRVRIVAQLLDAEHGHHLWAETYDRELTDIFAIQTDVALQIAAALKARLSPAEKTRIRKEPTDNIQAYQQFLLGKHCVARWTEEGIEQALKHFRQAVSLDPNYALPYASMASIYANIAVGVAGALPPAEAFTHAKAAVTRALEIDNGLAEAHAIQGYINYACDYDWAAAEAEFQEAVALDPNSGEVCAQYGLLLCALGRYDEAAAMQRRAHELDPVSHRIDIATTLLRAGRYDEGLRTARRVIEIDPHFAMAHATLGWAYLLTGAPAEGIAALERAVSLAPESTMYLAQLGHALARTGRVEEGREVLRRLEALSSQRYVSPYHMAYVHTGLGELDRAMDYLEQAYEQRAGAVFGIKGSFVFAPLREHPRFQALLARMNLAGQRASA